MHIIASTSILDIELQVYPAYGASLDMFLPVVADPYLPWPPSASSMDIESYFPESKTRSFRMNRHHDY